MQQKSSLNLKLGVERQKLRLIVSLTGPEDIQAQFQPLDWQVPTSLWFSHSSRVSASGPCKVSMHNLTK